MTKAVGKTKPARKTGAKVAARKDLISGAKTGSGPGRNPLPWNELDPEGRNDKGTTLRTNPYKRAVLKRLAADGACTVQELMDRLIARAAERYPEP